MPFFQDTKENLHDKGYQQLEGNRCVLTKKELCEIFGCKEREECMDEEQDLTSDEATILKKTYLLSKSVPRRSNRTKWRERSGFQPNILIEKSSAGTLFQGNLVCSRSAHGLVYHVVEVSTALDDEGVHVPVVTVDGSEKLAILHSDLVGDRGHIMALPSTLYRISRGQLVLCTPAAEEFDRILCEEYQQRDNELVTEED